MHGHVTDVVMATTNRKLETMDPGFDGVGRRRPDGQPMVGDQPVDMYTCVES